RPGVAAVRPGLGRSVRPVPRHAPRRLAAAPTTTLAARSPAIVVARAPRGRSRRHRSRRLPALARGPGGRAPAARHSRGRLAAAAPPVFTPGPARPPPPDALRPQ